MKAVLGTAFLLQVRNISCMYKKFLIEWMYVWGDRMKLTWKDCIKICVSAIAIYSFIFYWKDVAELIGVLFNASTPIIIGLAIAYILNILMSYYENIYKYVPRDYEKMHKQKRGVCLLAAILTLLGIIALVVWIVIPELLSALKFLIAEIPPIIDSLLKSEFATTTIPEEILNQFTKVNWNEMITKGTQVLTSGIGSAVNTVVTTISTITSVLITGLISLIFAIYFLLSKEQLQSQSKRVLHLYLPSDVEQKVSHVLTILNDSFHRYIVGQALEAVIIGVLCILGMFLFQFPYAVMVGTLIGFTALIPVAGAYIGAGVGAIMILTVSPVKALLFLVFIVVLQQLEGNLIYPKVVGKSVGLPAVWVLAGVTIGGGLYGILGMLIGVPLVSTGYRLLHEDMVKKEKMIEN